MSINVMPCLPCKFVSNLLPNQLIGGRLRTCSLGLYGGKVSRLIECISCPSYSSPEENVRRIQFNRDTANKQLTPSPPIRLNTREYRNGIKWCYGITTVPDRRETHFPRTLKCLKDNGFDQPRLFIDGCDNPRSWESEFNLEVTNHYPKIRTYGNWILGLAELYIRDAWADRYAIFQDDFICSKNLKQYLDSWELPDKGYWNLYTFPKNQDKCPTGHIGWYESNQRGLGAVALVFSREAVTTLLFSQHMIDRPKDLIRGWRAIDGGIVTALNKAGWKEYVHNPSLVQHIGTYSSMQNREQPLANSFKGEQYDLMSLLVGGSNV